MRNFKLHLFTILFSAFVLTGCERTIGDAPDIDPPIVVKPPIVLDCNYFLQDRVLVNDPDAPVDYIIKCVMKVSGDIKIEPGVVIEFEQDAGINIDNFGIPKASLSAVGTSAKPVVFRGVKKEKGYWRGIMFNSNSPENKLDYAIVEHAGGKAFNSNGDRGAVHVYANGKLSLTNSEIKESQTYGLNAVYKEISLVLENTKFKNNDTPVIINPNNISSITPTNDYAGNTKNFVIVEGGDIKTDATWYKVNVPYIVSAKSAYGTTNQIRVLKLLTIQPGVHIEHEAGVMIKIEEGGGGIKAVGTSADPIILTAVNKVVNGWVGYYFNSAHPLNEIAFTEFHYSGKTTGSGGSESGSVRLWFNNLLNIHDVKFKNINGCAINYGLLSSQSENPLLTINNVTVEPEGCLKKTF